jgi:glycosyltransferase involved in cell wall biosynthesis
MLNCEKEEQHAGVRYIPLAGLPPKKVDVVIHGSSGGDLDLTSAWTLPVAAKLVGVKASGITPIRGLVPGKWGTLYVPSNFMRDVVVDRWGIPAEKVMVIYNAIEAGFFAGSSHPHKRDPYRMVYLGHPRKGLRETMQIFRKIHQREPRTSLHLYGGTRLWGQPEQAVAEEPGVTYHGLIGQRALASELSKAGFALFLQEMEEAFGISVAESLRAGCVCLVSPVGALPELVQDGENGFLVQGHPGSQAVQESVVEKVLQLLDSPEQIAAIRRAASNFPWTWDRVAKVWSAHWHWQLGIEPRPEIAEYSFQPAACPACGGDWLVLEDGSHCTKCGRYVPRINHP